MTGLRIMAVDDERLALRRIELLLADMADVDLIAMCDDPLEALEQIEASKPDLLLLDIHMAGLGGIELAERLVGSGGHLPQIVFVTAYNHHAVRAFETRAIDYVLKPVTPARLGRAIEHARRLVERERATERAVELQRLIDELRTDPQLAAIERDSQEIWAQRGGDHVRLLVRDIEWAESERDYVHVHNHQRAYLLRSTLGALHDRLGADLYLRVRRSALVRLDRVESIRDRGYGNVHVILRSGAEVRVGRTYLKQLRERLRQMPAAPNADAATG